MHFDVSNTGIVCVFEGRYNKIISYINLSQLGTIKFSLLSSIKKSENKCIFWFTNNFSTQQIIWCGSNKPHIHSIGLNIFDLTFDQKNDLEFLWVGWQYNKEAEKTIDFDKCQTTQHLINILEQYSGTTSLDKFVSDINRKTTRFNSKYLCPKTESIKAFLFIRSNETNLQQHISNEELSKIF